MKEIFFMSDIGPQRIIDYDTKKKFGSVIKVLATCPLCKETHWTSITNVRSRPQQTTYCREHLWASRIKWAKPEDFCDRKNFIADFSKQKLEYCYSTHQKGAYISVECPCCHTQRWCQIRRLRNNQNTTFCQKCANRIRGKSVQQEYWDAGKSLDYSIFNGYKYIHEMAIIKKFSQETFDYVKKYIKCHKKFYYAEHRVVALLTYGPQSVAPGMVVRHIDGNKTNNSPENILFGTQSDNIRDHVQDRRDMKMWRGIALTLFRMLCLSK